MKKIIFLLCIFSLCLPLYAQKQKLEKEINSIIKDKNATVGLAVIFNGKDTLTVNNNVHYPMMSVYKLHQALPLLDYMDKKSLPLETEIFIKKTDLRPNTYSPLRDAHPEGNFTISIGELINYIISKSDNNASNILFHYMSGTQMTDLYIRTLGIKNFAIEVTEAEMEPDFKNQYLNWTTPLEAARLLDIFRKGELFSKKYNDFLLKAMVETTTGPDKLKAFLPKNVIVAHKTGTSSRNEDKLKAADNDIGIVYLPSGKQYSIAVFVKDSKEDDKTNARIIADISKAVYEYYKDK